MTTTPPAVSAPPAAAGRMLSVRAWAAPVAAFAAFGGLAGWRVADHAAGAGAGVAVGAIFAFLASHLLVAVLRLASPRVGRDGVGEAAAVGLFLLLPFAALALAAELLLGWNASQVFASAGLMTACGAVGADVGMRGGGTIRSALVSTVFAALASTAWVLLAVIAGGIWS